MDGAIVESDTAAHSDEHFQRVLTEMEQVKERVVAIKNWFRRHSTRPRILFQLTGSITIVLSILVPFLATVEGNWRTTLLPIVTLAIAGLTSLNAFFQWQSQWQGHRQTQYALEHYLAKWEVGVVRAKYHADREEAIEMVLQATSDLLDQSRVVTNSTTDHFFQNIKLPTAS